MIILVNKYYRLIAKRKKNKQTKNKHLEFFSGEESDSEKGKKKGLKQSADDLSETTDLIPNTSDFIKNCSLFHWQHNSWAWQIQMGRMVEVVNSRSSTLSSKSGGHTFKSWLKNSIFPNRTNPVIQVLAYMSPWVTD